MTHAMAARRLRDTGQPDGHLERALDDRLVDVVTSPLAGAGHRVEPRTREHPLPRPLARCGGVLASECIGQCDAAPPGVEVGPVLTARPFEMGLQGQAQPRRQGGHTVLASLAVTHGDLAPCKIHVFDAQAAALEEPQSRAVHQ
jgi:hypothetical protein